MLFYTSTCDVSLIRVETRRNWCNPHEQKVTLEQLIYILMFTRKFCQIIIIIWKICAFFDLLISVYICKVFLLIWLTFVHSNSLIIIPTYAKFSWETTYYLYRYKWCSESAIIHIDMWSCPLYSTRTLGQWMIGSVYMALVPYSELNLLSAAKYWAILSINSLLTSIRLNSIMSDTQ